MSPGRSRIGSLSPFPAEPGLRWAYIAAGTLGAACGFPNALLHFPLAVLLYPACLYSLAALAPTPKKALLYGWLTGIGAHCAGLYWLVYPMHDVGQLPFPLTIPAVLLLCAYLALYSALACLGMFTLQSLLLRQETAATCGIVRVLAAAVLSGLVFAGMEVLGGTLFTGFPWLALNTAFAFQPVWIQGASLFGGHGLTAVLAAAACLAAGIPFLSRKAVQAAAAACALLVLLLPPLYGTVRMNAAAETEDQAFDLIMVQGNIDQNQKWEPAFQKATLDLYLVLSEQAMREHGLAVPENGSIRRERPLLVVWPETAMPFYYQLHYDYAETLLRFAADNNLHLAFGALGIRFADGGNNILYNRMYLATPDGRIGGYYDKRHLVPFGEYIPFGTSLTFLQNILQGLDFSAGPAQNPLFVRSRIHAPSRRPGSGAEKDAPQGLSLGALICYEAIFPYLAQEQTERGATVLVNISNDGWFRKSSAPLQHLSHAVMRAVEQNRPLVRSTNTGITALIDEQGRITSNGSPLFTEDVFTAVVRPVTGTSLYHRLFPVPEYFFAAVAFAVTALAVKRRKQSNRKHHAPTR